MKRYSSEDIKKRLPLVKASHEFITVSDKKDRLLKFRGRTWESEFNLGAIEPIIDAYNQVKRIVDQQIELVYSINHLLHAEEEHIETVLSHYNFPELQREEADLQKLSLQMHKIAGFLSVEQNLIKKTRAVKTYDKARLLDQIVRYDKSISEFFRGITPFWHDWEVVASKVDHIMQRIEMSTEEDWNAIKKEIHEYVSKMHGEFSEDGKAPQLGTELAINLMFNDADINKQQGGIPIAVINIDVTSCNSLDGSHRLGNALIKYCYEELDKALTRDFEFGKKNKLSGVGVVTILGRTRFKIVGVDKKELEKAMQELPGRVLKRLKRLAKLVLKDSHHSDNVKMLNTTMLAGFAIASLGDNKREIMDMIANLRSYGTFGAKTPDEHSRVAVLRGIEHSMGDAIVKATKLAAARAEYLEKEVVPREVQKKTEIFMKELSKAGLSVVPENEDQRNKLDKIRDKVWKDFASVLVYEEKIDPLYLGRNYVPEDEFEGRMIERIGHQIGMDKMYLRELDQAVRKSFQSAKPNIKELEDLKKKFIEQVLQKRALATAYDVRFKRALRENAYDETLAAATFSEGPQIWTFIEIDGFNAFNRVFFPDHEDSYYHMILKEVYLQFEKEFGDDDIRLRMTKQGDEIWISYPLNTPKGVVKEKRHRRFLESFQKRLIERSNALTVINSGTARWVPHLILDVEKTKDVVQKSLAAGTDVKYIDNDVYYDNYKRKLSVHWAGEEDLSEANLSAFLDDDFLKKAVKVNKDENSFDKWRSFANGIDISRRGPGDKELKLPTMLFPELLKKEIGGGNSIRFRTGRNIRLGTTIGYMGFEKLYFMPRNAKEVKEHRENLNEAVEDVRKNIGRGGLHNVKLKS